MKNILKLKLFGYTVRGKDLRDDSGFEDHIVVSNLDGDDFDNRIDFIENHYNKLGFKVYGGDIIPDRKPGYKSKEGVAVDFDLHELYLQKLKALKEQQYDI